MAFEPDSPLQRLRRWDERREGIPGEHWIGFGLGVYLLRRRSSSRLGGLLSFVLGAAFVARSLSGRDGLIATLQRPEPPARQSLERGTVD